MKELSLHILDIMENSVNGGASRIEVNITINEADDLIEIKIVDDGTGMDSETLARVSDPFYTTRSTRKIGMGISLFKQQAYQTGGAFSIKSELGKGTIVDASFGLSHIDRQPLGDVAGVIVNLAASYENIDVLLNINTLNGEYRFSSHSITEILEGIPINKPEVMLWLKELIQTNMTELTLIK